MRRVIIAFLFLMISLFFGLPGEAAASGSLRTTTIRPVLTPTPTNLQAFTAPSACAQHPGAPNCADALAHGLMLFAWSCAGCAPGWSALFVVNGQALAPGDINLAPSKVLALSVRQNQFKSTDCVAIRIYNPASPGQNATSNALCLSQVLAIHAITPRAPGALNGNISAQSSRVNPVLNHGVILNPNYVPGPTGMGSTHDPKVCTAHGGFGGGLACTAGLPSGMLPLIWNCPNCQVDGYHLYRVDSGQHTLMPANGAYSNDATVTLALLDAPSDGFNGKCYAVTAYKGSNESQLSNAYCAGNGSVMATMTLSAAHVLHWNRLRNLRTGGLGYTDPPVDSYDSSLYVGYGFHYWDNPFGDIYGNRVNRTGLYFDLSPLAGRTISKAVLHLVAQSSWHDYGGTGSSLADQTLTDQTPEACVTSVDKATDHWWENNNLASTVSYISPGPYMGPSFDVDVTSAIQSWMGYAAPSNFGFVLRGANENDQYHGNSNSVCLTLLESASLVVTYY